MKQYQRYNFLSKNTSHLLKILTVKEAVRKLGRIECPKQEVSFWENFCCKLGLKTFKFKRFFDKKNYIYYLLISQKNDYLEEATTHHYNEIANIGLKNDGCQNFILGRLYGYPECCINYFIKNLKLVRKEGDDKLKIKTIKKLKSQYLPWAMNNFLSSRIIFHHICSYKCRKTTNLSEKNIKIIKNFDKNIYETIKKSNRVGLMVYRNNFLIAPQKYFLSNNQKIQIPISGSRKIKKDNYLEFKKDKTKFFIFD